MCPLCDPITPLPFPLFPCGVVTCGSEQVRAAHLLAWGCLSTPGVTQTGSFVGLSGWIVQERMVGNYQQSEVRLQVCGL